MSLDLRIQLPSRHIFHQAGAWQNWWIKSEQWQSRVSSKHGRMKKMNTWLVQFMSICSSIVSRYDSSRILYINLLIFIHLMKFGNSGQFYSLKSLPSSWSKNAVLAWWSSSLGSLANTIALIQGYERILAWWETLLGINFFVYFCLRGSMGASGFNFSNFLFIFCFIVLVWVHSCIMGDFCEVSIFCAFVFWR